MNISKVTKLKSYQIGKSIMHKPIEYGFEIDMKGQIKDKFVGNKDGIKVQFNKKSPFQFYQAKRNSIFIHNHPNTSLLSFPDLIFGIYHNFKETQAVNKVFTHLMEIPKELTDTQRAVCLYVVRKYEKIHTIFKQKIIEKMGAPNDEVLSKSFMKYNRLMEKELNLAGGIRFRTIPSCEKAKQIFLKLHSQHKLMDVKT